MKLTSPSPRPTTITTQVGDSESLEMSALASPVPSVVRPVPAAMTPPNSSQAPMAPIPAAPVHALRIVKRPKVHDKAASVSSVGSRSAGISVSTKEQITQAASSVPVHKPVLTGVRRPPPGLMPPLQVRPGAEENVRPALSVKGKLTSVLGLRTKTIESPRSSFEAGTSSQPTETEVGGAVKSRILKPTASSLSKAPSIKMPTASKTTTASKVTRPPSRFANVGMASGLPRPTGGVQSSSRLPVPASSAPNSKPPNTIGSSNMIGRSATIRRV